MAMIGISLAMTRVGGVGRSTLNNDLQAYYKLDEESGSRADALGTNDLTESGSVTFQAGKQGNAAEFDFATKPYLSCLDHAALSFGDEAFTIAGWYYHTDAGNTQYLVVKGPVAAASCEHVLIYSSGNTRLRFFISDGTTITSPDAVVALSLNTWYHFRCWHDPDENEVGIQLNNGSKFTSAHAVGVQDGAQPFGLGGTATVSGLDGYLDEVGVWRRLLSDDENTALYNGEDGSTYPF